MLIGKPVRFVCCGRSMIGDTLFVLSAALLTSNDVA